MKDRLSSQKRRQTALEKLKEGQTHAQFSLFALKKEGNSADAKAQLVKCLMLPNEDLSLEILNPHKKLSVSACTPYVHTYGVCVCRHRKIQEFLGRPT